MLCTAFRSVTRCQSIELNFWQKKSSKHNVHPQKQNPILGLNLEVQGSKQGDKHIHSKILQEVMAFAVHKCVQNDMIFLRIGYFLLFSRTK
jgi:hypothetical protein